MKLIDNQLLNGLADDDTAEAIKIVNGYSSCEETVVGSHTSHHYIANQEIGLCHCHVMLLRRLTLDEVQHGRWGMSATPRIRCKMRSSIRVRAKKAMVETMMNVSKIGQSRCHVT